MPDHSEELLKAILSVIGRQAFPTAALRELVLAKGAGAKQLAAFNLCDGTRAQGEIAKTLKLDSGNFSKTVARWIEAGVVFRIGDGREARLLHVYRLQPESSSKGGRA